MCEIPELGAGIVWSRFRWAGTNSTVVSFRRFLLGATGARLLQNPLFLNWLVGLFDWAGRTTST